MKCIEYLNLKNQINVYGFKTAILYMSSGNHNPTRKNDRVQYIKSKVKYIDLIVAGLKNIVQSCCADIHVYTTVPISTIFLICVVLFV